MTADGFATATVSRNGVYSLQTVLALDPSGSGAALLLGFNSKVSTNAGLSWTEIQGLAPSDFPMLWEPINAWVLPGSDLRAIITNDTSFYSGIGVFRYDHSARRYTDDTPALTSVLANDRPAGLEAFNTGASVVFRLISATGGIAQSTDGGVSFAALPGAEGGLDPCNVRHIASLASDRSVVATWCGNAPRLAYSKNSGRTWTSVEGGAWSTLACLVNGLVVTSKHLVVSCLDGPIVRLGY
ncbi:MAG: hypothetical protein IPG96_03795 [Proteobacteria bacterium]|nr:hypothetical protein [Pseudomonadota bacterium]